MTKAPHLDDAPDHVPADEQAFAWVVRLTSGDSTPEEHAQFRRWRDASPSHVTALAQARRLWLEMEIAAPEIVQMQDKERIGTSAPSSALHDRGSAVR